MLFVNFTLVIVTPFSWKRLEIIIITQEATSQRKAHCQVYYNPDTNDLNWWQGPHESIYVQCKSLHCLKWKVILIWLNTFLNLINGLNQCWIWAKLKLRTSQYAWWSCLKVAACKRIPYWVLCSLCVVVKKQILLIRDLKPLYKLWLHQV